MLTTMNLRRNDDDDDDDDDDDGDDVELVFMSNTCLSTTGDANDD